MMFVAYNVLLTLAAAFAVPYYGAKILFTGKYRQSIGPKFGFNRADLFGDMKGAPRIWMHAVSVGEVTAAAPIMAALRAEYPQACLVLSTGTETGQEMAHRLVPEATAIIYFPIDIPYVVRKIIRLIRPDIFVLTETELWPNFLRACREQGIGAVMVNGRISPRSFKKYHITRFFWRHILGYVDQMGMISEIDAERVRAIGMKADKIKVIGNAKYDGLAAKVSAVLQEETARRLNLTTQRVLVAGSTHPGEETAIIDVFRKLQAVYPDFILILAPRHVDRALEAVHLVRQAGYESLTVSEIDRGRIRRNETVVIVDKIGELFRMYSLASLVFCGGSLAPRGGQNILEPAAWGKIVFYGPFMDDFGDEKTLLEAVGAGIAVKDGHELAGRMLAVLQKPEIWTAKGEAAGRAVAANRGASHRYAALIGEVLKKSGKPAAEPEISR